MATYSTDLQTFHLADNATGWAELTNHLGGSAPSQDTENFIHNASAVSQATGQALGTSAGMEYNNGSAVSWTSGYVFMVWQFYAAPTNLYSWASGGIRIGIGSSSGNIKFWNAMGDNFGDYPYGGWQNTAIDPEITADATEGTPVAGSYSVFGSLLNTRAKITKGSPHVCDAIRYGRGEIRATGADATFVGMAAANDVDTARWGLFQAKAGAYLWKGLMSLGLTATSVTFSDLNKTIRVEDTPRVAAGFNKVEINNSGSSVTMSGVTFQGVQTSITGSGPVSPGDFEVVDNATVDLDSCTFIDMGIFTFNAGTNPNTIDDSIFRRCDGIVQGGASFTSCTFNSCGPLVSDSLSNISGCSFISSGTGHAIEIDTPGTYTLAGAIFTGYGANDTTDAAIYNNSGGSVTINISGGATPTVRNGSGASTTVNNAVSLTISSNVSLVGAEVRIYDLDNNPAGSLGTELSGVESHNAATYVYSGSGGNEIWIQIMKSGYAEFGQSYTMPSIDGTFTALLKADLNA